MKKKILAMLLAATMMAGATMTVCAADETLNSVSGAIAGQEVTGDSTVNLPTIKVTVPTTANIVINPYQMSYESSDKTITGNSQIISAEQTIKNESDVAVVVNVEGLKATPSDGVTVSSTALTAKNTEKAVFMYLEVVDSAAEFKTTYDAKATSQIIATDTSDGKTKAGAKEAIVTLGVGSETATEAKFKFGGAAVANPVTINSDKTTTANPWTDSDAIQVAFKFTFTPQVVTE